MCASLHLALHGANRHLIVLNRLEPQYVWADDGNQPAMSSTHWRFPVTHCLWIPPITFAHCHHIAPAGNHIASGRQADQIESTTDSLCWISQCTSAEYNTCRPEAGMREPCPGGLDGTQGKFKLKSGRTNRFRQWGFLQLTKFTMVIEHMWGNSALSKSFHICSA